MGSKIQPVRLNNFRISVSILMGLFSVDAPRSRGDKMSTIITMPAPKNLWRQKIVQHFSPFLTTFDFDREYLRNESTYHIKTRKSSWPCTTPPTLCEKNLAYFGPQTKKLLTLIYVHPNGLYPEDYISALRGCCAIQFLYALVID